MDSDPCRTTGTLSQPGGDLRARLRAFIALDAGRLEVAQQQIAEDFFTPPLFADWISFTDTWYPTLQGIILGDMSVEEGLEQGATDAHDLLDSFGYYE